MGGELFTVARATSSALGVLAVKGAPSPEVARARAAQFWASRATLRHGLALLGLPALDRV